MKKRYESLRVREVPPELDGRILAAAAGAARRNRMRRIFRAWCWSGSAVAAAFLAGFVIFHQPQPVDTVSHTGAERQELPALMDWSTLEQAGYNLAFELDSGNLSVAELAEARIPEGF